MDMLSHRAYLAGMDDTPTIDARGLLCPLPVLKLRKRIKPHPAGTRLTLLADDPAAIVDVPHYCAESGNRLISVSEADGHQIYLVEKT